MELGNAALEYSTYRSYTEGGEGVNLQVAHSNMMRSVCRIGDMKG